MVHRICLTYQESVSCSLSTHDTLTSPSILRGRNGNPLEETENQQRVGFLGSVMTASQNAKLTTHREPSVPGRRRPAWWPTQTQEAQQLTQLIRRASAAEPLHRLRGEPLPPTHEFPNRIKGDELQLLCGLMDAFLRPGNRTDLLITLNTTRTLKAPQRDLALAVAVSSWPISDITQVIKESSDSYLLCSGHKVIQSYMPDDAIRLATLSDGMRILTGEPTGALDLIRNMAPYSDSMTFSSELSAALNRLSQLPLSREERWSLLEWTVRVMPRSMPRQLKHWMTLFPHSSDLADLPPRLRRSSGLDSGTPAKFIWHLREAAHPLECHLPGLGNWEPSLPSLPPPILEARGAPDQKWGKHVAAGVRELMHELQTHLNTHCPPGTGSAQLRAHFSQTHTQTPLGALIFAALGGGTADPAQRLWRQPDEQLRQWSALCAGLTELDPGHWAHPVFAEISASRPDGSAKQSHEHTLLSLCRAGWPPGALAVTMTAQMNAHFAASKVEDPQRSRTPDAAWGEDLLEYWRAIRLNSEARQTMQTIISVRHPGYTPRLPALNYQNDPDLRADRAFTAAISLAIHTALSRRSADQDLK